MASVGIIQRRDTKYNLTKLKPLIGEIVFAIDTEEYGTIVSGQLVWKKFEDVIKSVAGKTGDVILNKTDVQLGNVDNTSDIDKPLSNADLQKWVEHLAAVNPHNIDKTLIGLENVDNTSDIDKPISTATQNVLDGKLGIHEIAYDSLRLGGILAEDLTLDTYSKVEIDDKLSVKVNVDNVYSKVEVDNKILTINDDLLLKANTSDVYIRTDADATFEKISNKGIPNGYAGLDSNGKIPTDELYSNKEIEEFESILNFPIVGQSNYLYIDKLNNSIYRYNAITTLYEALSISLGETDLTAYRGDYGKIAYEHTLNSNNPHETTYLQVGAAPAIHTHDSILTVKSVDNSYIIDKVTEIEVDTDSALKINSSQTGKVTLTSAKSFEKITDGINDIAANITPNIELTSTNQIIPQVVNDKIEFKLNAYTFTSSTPAVYFNITHNLGTFVVLVNIYVLNTSGQWEYSILPYKMITENMLDINLSVAKNIMVNIIPLAEIS